MRVTKIESQKKHRGRKSVFADGEFLIGISDETLMATGIRSGDELGAEKLRVLKEIEQLNSARRTALRYLATRPRTEREIRDKLREKEFSDADIRKVLDELLRSNLVNDAEFARMYLRDALQRRPPGRLLLKQKMLLLGLHKELIEESLNELYPEQEQGDKARQAAESFMARKARPKNPEEWLKMKTQLSGFLVRRGYTWEIVQPVLKETLGIRYAGRDEDEQSSV